MKAKYNIVSEPDSLHTAKGLVPRLHMEPPLLELCILTCHPILSTDLQFWVQEKLQLDICLVYSTAETASG